MSTTCPVRFYCPVTELHSGFQCRSSDLVPNEHYFWTDTDGSTIPCPAGCSCSRNAFVYPKYKGGWLKQECSAGAWCPERSNRPRQSCPAELCPKQFVRLHGAYFPSTSQPPGQESYSSRRPGSLADWTIAWFSFTDKELDGLVFRDLYNVCGDEGSAESVRVAVHAVFDTSLQGSWRLKADPGSAVFTIDRVDTPQPISDPAVLTGLLSRAFAESPARRYGLVLSGHGSVYMIRGAPREDFISVDAVSAAVRAALPPHVPKLDFVSWDSCLMASVSTLAASSEFAHYATAHEPYCGDNGFMVKNVLSLFTDTVSTPDLLIAVQKRYLEECPPDDECRKSVFRLEAVPALVEAAHSLQRAFCPKIYRDLCARSSELMVDPEWPHVIDVRVLTEFMHKQSKLSTAELDCVSRALGNVIVHSVRTPALREARAACGVSISVCPNLDKTSYDVSNLWKNVTSTVLLLLDKEQTNWR
jgi:hypothetical protein